MAHMNCTNTSNADFCLTTLTISRDTIWTTLFRIIQMYFVPVFSANALLGNALIIVFTSTRNAFSHQTSFTVRSYYVAFALADFVIVIFYNLLTWLGTFILFVKENQKRFIKRDYRFSLTIISTVCVNIYVSA